MKTTITTPILGFLFASMVTTASFAGGRYADPPTGLVEVSKLTQQALDAAKQGNKDAALASANEARKVAVASYKEKSTMPMQNGSSRLKAAVASLEGGNTAEAVTPLEETVKIMNDEIDFYKKEGKL